MNGMKLHSAVREMQRFFRSPRFWATVLLVALVFTVIGAFNTGVTMPPLQRFCFWAMLHGMAFTVALVFATIADVLLTPLIPLRLARMMLGSALAAAPIGVFVSVLQWGFMGDAINGPEITKQIATSLPLCLLLCLLTYLTSGQSEVPAASAAQASAQQPALGETAKSPPRILDRLNPQNRGQLLRLSSQDHYTQVVTSRGKELILLRFSDALMETDGAAGCQIHRSHWVADAHVREVKRINGKLVIITQDDSELPVSRANEPAIRARYGKTG